ncbi:uncharacterized protein [Ptychodera flava]|uniref:uncharacterized protein n=1 Tax=Ptychodera flava TaxID=63121 RepID=UPI003969F7C5
MYNTDGSFLCQCSSGYTLTPDGLSCTDTEVPNIFGCPENITTSIEDGNTAARVKWNLPSATDNSQIPPTMNSTHNPGEYFTVGDSNVEYVFTDSSGNRAVCSFTITVLDTLPPEIKYCPDNVTIFADPGENSTIVTWFPPLATDNSGPLSSITSTARPRQFFQIGKTEVVYVFADLFSNTASCTFYVTVIGDPTTWEDIWYTADDPIIGVGSNYQMYVQSGLTGRWYGPIPNSCCVQDIASMNGGVIIGIGFDYRVWKKVHIDSPWEGPDHSSCCVISISVTMDNTQWAVSIDNSILYRYGFSSPWKTSQISKYQGGLSKIYHMSSGMLLATSFEMEVLSRDCRTAPSEWTLVDSNMLLSDVFVTRNGTMVGVGIGYMFTKSDFYEAWKGPIIGNAEIYTATNGRTSEGQNFINSDSGCGNPKYLRSENGTFTSMGFHSGHPYQDNCFCQWEIVVSIGKVVVLSFEFLICNGIYFVCMTKSLCTTMCRTNLQRFMSFAAVKLPQWSFLPEIG